MTEPLFDAPFIMPVPRRQLFKVMFTDGRTLLVVGDELDSHLRLFACQCAGIDIDNPAASIAGIANLGEAE